MAAHIAAMSDAMHIFDRRAVRAHRDRAAGRSAEYEFLFREVADRLADRLRDVARSFPLALDLGCRSGALGDSLRGYGGIETLIGCDLSERMARRAGGPSAANPVIVADEEALPFAEGRIDLVIGNLSLHWVNDLPGALVQVRRCLKPDGLFLAALFGGDTLCELRACLMEAEIELRDGASPRISPFVQIRDAGGLLQRAGFALPVVDSDKITVTYDNALRLMADLRGMGESAAAEARPRRFTPHGVLMRAAEHYQRRHTGPDGRIAATFEVIFLHGWAPDDSQPKALRPGSATASLAEAVIGKENRD